MPTNASDPTTSPSRIDADGAIQALGPTLTLPPTYRVGDHQALRPNLDIVGDVNQVIDLCSLSNHGIVQSASIDTSVGSYLDVVLDKNAADVGKMCQGTVILAGIAKPRATDHGPSVDGDVASDTGAVMKDDTRVDDAAVSYLAVSDDYVSTDEDVGSDCCVGVNCSEGRDAPWWRWREESLHNADEGLAGLPDDHKGRDSRFAGVERRVIRTKNRLGC